MSDDLKLQFEIVGRDDASASLRTVEASLRSVFDTLKAVERQSLRTSKALKSSLSGGLMGGGTGSSGAAAEVRNIEKVAVARVKATTDAVRNAGKVWRLRENSEKAERTGIAATGKAWADAQRRRMSIMDRSAAVELRRQRDATRAEVRAIRETADARAQAERDSFRQIRQRWNVRERSERQERREAERVTKVSAATAASQAKAEAAATDHRMNGIARTWRLRQASEAGELRHLKAVGRERAAMRRDAMRSGREALQHGRHAVRSMNHPVHESAGFALATGAAAGAAFAEHIVRASEAFDTSMTRLKMFAPSLDAEVIRKQALGDSINLGVDASKLVDSIAKSVRDGVPPEIAKTLPKSIVSAAQVMGGDVEKLTDSLAEGLQEAFSMGWLKTSTDARRFLNTEAGLSTFQGNSAAKQEQFIAAGGLGHGKEIGLDMTNSLAYGAMLNASGARTGQASARFMGQLSQNVPKLFDYYRIAVQSHRNTEEDRAVRSAPGKLGYGSIREMQQRIMAGPEGLIDFATRLERLDDKQRKLVLQGFHFSEQGGAMLAELGANGGAKGKAVIARAKELAAQKEANDYLSDKFAEWQKSLSNMLKQVEAGWRAIENEIGDVIKSDIIAPFRDWWVILSDSIVHSDLKARMHATIQGLIHGLGFDDLHQMLDTMTGKAKGFDVAGFAKGIGEGIRSTIDSFHSLAGVFGGAGGISAETVGRVAAEMLGLSVALKAISPVLSVMTGVVESFKALSAVLKTAQGLGLLMGVAGAGEGAGAMATIGAAAAATGVGLAAMLGIAVVGGALAVAVMNWPAIKAWWGNTMPGWMGGRGLKDGRTKDDDAAPPTPPSTIDQLNDAWKFSPMAYRGAGGDDYSSLRRDISWSPSDSGDVIRNATVGTERGVLELREAVDRLAVRLALAGFGGSTGDGGGDGGGRPNIRFGHAGSTLGGAMPNIRYGHGATTPGSGQAREIGPHVSLGKMGAKFAQKAPVLMDGLMKKYGLTREQAAGIVGNLGHESAGFTAYHEGGQAPGKGGVGWAQWTGPRRRAFEKWTAAHGLNPTSDEASWRYLTEGDPETAKAILAVKRTTNRRDAVRAWEQSFERAGVKAYGSRDRYADKAFAAQPGGATVTADKPLGTEANPITVRPDVKSIGKGMSPADIAGHIRSQTRPRDDVPAGTTADNSTTHHHTHTWNINGAHDPNAVARTVVAHLDRSNSRYTDSESVA